MTSFLYRVGMSNLFNSFTVGFNSAFYGASYFLKDPIKSENDPLGFDWWTSKCLLILYFCEALLIICKKTDFSFNFNNVTINIINIIHTVFEIKLKRKRKWNVNCLQKLPFAHDLQSRCFLKYYSQENTCVGNTF